METTNELIQGCIKGNRAAQNRLYEQYAPAMLTVCMRYAKNKEEAEDILLEGFMKVFTHIQQYQGNGSFEGWIRRIMVNGALQRFRGKAYLHAVINVEESAYDFPEKETILASIGTKELLQMIQQLPPAYRMVFNLVVFEGMKHREIAELLGIAEGTSKSNLSDARNLLQHMVQLSLQVASQKVSYL